MEETKTRIDELRELVQREAACIGRAYEERLGITDLISHVTAHAKYLNELHGLEAKFHGKGR